MTITPSVNETIRRIKRLAPKGSVLHGDVIPLEGEVDRLVAISVLGGKDLTPEIVHLFNFRQMTRENRTYAVINGVGVDVVKAIIDRLAREIYLDAEAYRYDLEEKQERARS